MSTKTVKKVCTCENCGNEAEMTFTCSLEHEHEGAAAGKASEQGKSKGTAVCTQCGNEAEMWIDL
ncbi:hypothetical protein ACFL0Q_00455 [Thermodesulfobacteriota bacterium]